MESKNPQQPNSRGSKKSNNFSLLNDQSIQSSKISGEYICNNTKEIGSPTKAAFTDQNITLQTSTLENKITTEQ